MTIKMLNLFFEVLRWAGVACITSSCIGLSVIGVRHSNLFNEISARTKGKLDSIDRKILKYSSVLGIVGFVVLFIGLMSGRI